MLLAAIANSGALAGLIVEARRKRTETHGGRLDCLWMESSDNDHLLLQELPRSWANSTMINAKYEILCFLPKHLHLDLLRPPNLVLPLISRC